MGFIAELKRRNVFRVGTAYALLGWVVVQVTDIAVPALRLPDWVPSLVFYLGLIGFPFALLFAWAFELTPDGLKLEKDVDREQSITHSTGRKIDFIIIGLLAVAVVFLVIDKFLLVPEGDAQPAREAAPEAGATAEQPDKSIAVLPFVNMSSDREQEYFSDGISEEILNSLASVKELKVAGRTSSFAFKGQNQDLRKIGAALGVGHILEGSVRKAGAKVRITAQLIQVDDGFHLWSDTYDRELTDVFAIQDEIASAILQALKAKLLGDDQRGLAASRTEPEIYDQYLLARKLIYERSIQAIQSSVELLGSAIGKDPEYAPAYALRGIAYLILGSNYDALAHEESQTLGKQDLDQALGLDAGLAEAWAGIGLYYLNERPGDYPAAIRALKKALAINPGLIDASNWRQLAYEDSGREDKAPVILEDMVKRDPLYRPGVNNIAGRYAVVGRSEEAFDLLNRVESYLPGDPFLQVTRALLLFLTGRCAEGLTVAEAVSRRQPLDGVAGSITDYGLYCSHQWERLAASTATRSDWKLYALDVLGREQEASTLAYEEAADGNLFPLFHLLVRNGRSAELLRYLDSRWTDLDAFQAENPYLPDSSYGSMLFIASAYLTAADDAGFQDAMARARAMQQHEIDAGLDNPVFDLRRAYYHMLAGDSENALSALDAAVSGGAILEVRIADTYPEFSALENDPRYRAIQSRMIENLNSQRAALGLEPVE